MVMKIISMLGIDEVHLLGNCSGVILVQTRQLSVTALSLWFLFTFCVVCAFTKIAKELHNNAAI